MYFTSLQNFHKSRPTYVPFQPFHNFQFVRLYLRNYDANLCEKETITLVSAILHNENLTTRTPWNLLRKNNCHFFFAGGGPNPSVNLQKAQLLIFSKKIVITF